MAARSVQTGRLRRRLTIAFMLVAALSGAVLAAGSYLVVRQDRLGDSVERSVEQARFNLILAGEIVGPVGGDADDVLAALERRGEFITVGKGNGRTFSSSVSVGPAQVPEDLERIVGRGELGYKRVTVGRARYLAVGGPVPDTELGLYFFFSEDRLWDELEQLRNILLGGLALLVLVAGVAGALLARRTLAPVARASTAARSLAEGLLDTRLPVESADEFGAWAQSFNEMADALEAKIAALSEAQARERRFTADVAHELRTPLTALLGEASLLAELLDRMPDEARRPAELLIDDVARLRRLVEDLMEISRFDAGRESVRPEPVDLGSVVSASIQARGWDGRVRVTGDGVVLTTDRRRLERIVANLIGNAVEHGGRDVSVRIGRDGVEAFIEVADRGSGVAPEHLPHLFERFYKADPARATRGSGLGLAIAMENARLLGGDIDVWSEVGSGSRFTLRLPVTEPLPTRDGRVADAEQDEARQSGGGKT